MFYLEVPQHAGSYCTVVDSEGFQGFHGKPLLKLISILVALNTLIEQSDRNTPMI